MKKTVLIGLMLALSACINKKPIPPQIEAEEAYTVPCSYSCMQENCTGGEITPMVLKPRVTETYSSSKKRRCCPDDVLSKTTENHTIVPNLPEIYVIAANRTANTMLEDAKAVFNQKKYVTVYVDKTKSNESDLPGGLNKGVDALTKRLNNVNTVSVTSQKNRADYIITPEVSWFDTPTKVVPAIKYQLVLNSKDGEKIGEWAEVIHQTKGDRSWW